MAISDMNPPMLIKQEEQEEPAPGSSNRSSSSEVSLTPNSSQQHADLTDGPQEVILPAEEEPAEASPRTKRRSGPKSKTSSYLGVTKVLNAFTRKPALARRCARGCVCCIRALKKIGWHIVVHRSMCGIAIHSPRIAIAQWVKLGEFDLPSYRRILLMSTVSIP